MCRSVEILSLYLCTISECKQLYVTSGRSNHITIDTHSTALVVLVPEGSHLATLADTHGFNGMYAIVKARCHHNHVWIRWMPRNPL